MEQGRGLSTQYVSQNPETIFVSIPLEQGRVFRPLKHFTTLKTFCLNPFRTGQGLSTYKKMAIKYHPDRLNPFGTGQGLSTSRVRINGKRQGVSIPLEQGGVFRHVKFRVLNALSSFQSLWSRAGSFDSKLDALDTLLKVSIPLEQGRVFRRDNLILIEKED